MIVVNHSSVLVFRYWSAGACLRKPNVSKLKNIFLNRFKVHGALPTRKPRFLQSLSSFFEPCSGGQTIAFHWLLLVCFPPPVRVKHSHSCSDATRVLDSPPACAPTSSWSSKTTCIHKTPPRLTHFDGCTPNLFLFSNYVLFFLALSSSLTPNSPLLHASLSKTVPFFTCLHPLRNVRCGSDFTLYSCFYSHCF